MNPTEQKVDVSDFWEAEHMLTETVAAVEALRDAVNGASKEFLSLTMALELLDIVKDNLQSARRQVQKGAGKSAEGEGGITGTVAIGGTGPVGVRGESPEGD